MKNKMKNSLSKILYFFCLSWPLLTGELQAQMDTASEGNNRQCLAKIASEAEKELSEEGHSPYSLPPCQLQSGEVLTIACTFGCEKKNVQVLQSVAKQLNYNLKFLQLNSDPSGPFTTGEEGASFFNMADAVLLEGGADVLPELYRDKWPQGEIPVNLSKLINKGMGEGDRDMWKRKDLFEFSFLKSYFQDEEFAQTPLLAICRGMQLLGVANGQRLYIDLAAQIGLPNRKFVQDPIKVIDPHSRMAHIMGQGGFSAFENHHQGIDYQYYLENQQKFPQVKVTATSNNGQVVEVIEFKNRKAMGLQFHPEWSSQEVQKRIFGHFLQLACVGKKARASNQDKSGNPVSQP